MIPLTSVNLLSCTLNILQLNLISSTYRYGYKGHVFRDIFLPKFQRANGSIRYVRVRVHVHVVTRTTGNKLMDGYYANPIMHKKRGTDLMVVR